MYFNANQTSNKLLTGNLVNNCHLIQSGIFITYIDLIELLTLINMISQMYPFISTCIACPLLWHSVQKPQKVSTIVTLISTYSQLIWMDGWLGFYSILSTHIVAISLSSHKSNSNLQLVMCKWNSYIYCITNTAI